MPTQPHILIYFDVIYNIDQNKEVQSCQVENDLDGLKKKVLNQKSIWSAQLMFSYQQILTPEEWISTAPPNLPLDFSY